MTGFESKRQAAQGKLDDDTQVQADTLLIVYQRGFADGKRSAQRPWVGLTKGQRDDFADAYGSYEAVCAIEQALQERNA
jgi:hypothetical protein